MLRSKMRYRRHLFFFYLKLNKQVIFASITFLKSSSNWYTLTSCNNFQMQPISRVTTTTSYLLSLFETAIRYSSGDKQAIEFMTLKLRSEMT